MSAFAANFEYVLRTSLTGFESRFSSAARSSGLFAERLRSFEQENKSELSHSNNGTETVRVSYYTKCIVAWRRVGYVTFNKGGTATVRVSHYTQCITA